MRWATSRCRRSCCRSERRRRRTMTTIEGLRPFRLAPWFSERPWGRRDLRPWYGAAATAGRTAPVGEAWLTGPACVVETGALAGQTLTAVVAEAGVALLGESGGAEFP